MNPNQRKRGQDEAKQPSKRHTSTPETQLALFIVGKQSKHFRVPEHLLIERSNFFRVALTGPFKEAYAKTVTLPEDSSTIFAFFVHWLKHGRFPDKNLDNDKFLIQLWKGPRTPACEFGHPDYLVRLYLFGDKYDIKILRNECILALISNLQRGKEPAWPSHLVINHAYKLLPPKSSLCRLLVEMICRCADEEYDFEKFESAPLLRAVCHGLTELKFENDVRRQVRYIDMNDFLEDW